MIKPILGKPLSFVDRSNEFIVQYPFLRDLLGMFQGFKRSFSKEELSKRYEEPRKILAAKFPQLTSLDVDSFLQLLFAIGFFGARVNGTDIYLHDNPDYPRIVLANIENLEAVVVHPAFHLALGLRRYIIIESNSGSYVGQVNNTYNQNIQIGGSNVGNINIDNVSRKEDKS